MQIEKILEHSKTKYLRVRVLLSSIAFWSMQFTGKREIKYSLWHTRAKKTEGECSDLHETIFKQNHCYYSQRVLKRLNGN